MAGTPQNIRRFEVLSLISIFIGLVQSFLDGSLIGNIVRAENSNLLGAARGQAVGAAIGGAVGYVVGVAIFIALTLLVSRRRKNWARWILLVWTVLGVAFIVWQGNARSIFSLDYPLATALVWLMQVVALVLVFTPQSTRWLRGDQSKDLRHVFG